MRNDGEIDFRWGTGAPALGVPTDNFSARWSRTIDFDEGTYRFFVLADDGVRVFVDGNRIIDGWRNQSGDELYETTLELSGSHRVTVEYYEATGGARVTAGYNRKGDVATATPSPTASPVPPTETAVPATATSAPATATNEPATATASPTATEVPATAIPATAIPATETPTQAPTPNPTATETPTTAPTATETPTTAPTATETPTTAPTATETATVTPTPTTQAVDPADALVTVSGLVCQAERGWGAGAHSLRAEYGHGRDDIAGGRSSGDGLHRLRSAGPVHCFCLGGRWGTASGARTPRRSRGRANRTSRWRLRWWPMRR